MRVSPAERRAFLTSLFDAAVDAAHPAKVIAANLPLRPKGRTVVVGAGKGSAQMARALESHWDGPLSGVVVTRYGFGVGCDRIEIIEASHPVPDDAGLVASERLFGAVSGLSSDDLVIAVISGGGSALLPAPPEGMSLADEIAVNKALLASGAPISAMNAVRKHLSTIKGGRLAAAAYPARVVSLIVSDIPGDDPALVASGPTVPDETTRYDALRSVERYRLSLPPSAISHLRSEAAVAPRPDDPRFAGNEVRIIASAAVSLEAAAAEARRRGIEAFVLSDAIEGEAREVARTHAALALQMAERNVGHRKPAVLLSGGETTVSLRGNGKGGRNCEFLLSLAIDIQGRSDIWSLAADTDGIDGSEENAGAFADGSTVARLAARSLDARALLDANDSWSAFHEIADLFSPGPTGTNVNDFRAILVE
ncbi:glycerate kinase [Ensifer sp. ENS06]|uniref:glycerate kinase type-2 family protein n=1 Tax=Ensifer sp. ENS06 TaxID=2769276 RepID=UPI000DDC3A57|nr:glycerate kinase [Ensifer sp. ENS06]MBD9624691.1 glycerate kinase [Ensifer sp. ENS06]